MRDVHPVSKNTPQGRLSIIEKSVYDSVNDLCITSASGFLATTAHLGMHLDMAVMAQRTQITGVIHQPMLLGIVNPIFHRATMMHLARRGYITLIITSLTQRMSREYTTAQLTPTPRVYKFPIILVLCHISNNFLSLIHFNIFSYFGRKLKMCLITSTVQPLPSMA